MTGKRCSIRACERFGDNIMRSIIQRAIAEPPRSVVPANLDPAAIGGAPYSNFMSTHLATSDPSPEAMMMQPRTFWVVLSLAHTA